MQRLLSMIKHILEQDQELPFAVYSSAKEQKLLNVPIAKPLLIVILNGDKELGKENKVTCHTGDFIFLTENSAVNIRNIPKNKEYFALLIEFDYKDFDDLPMNSSNKNKHYIGQMVPMLTACLQQFVESALWAPKSLWGLRKREIIALLCHLGHGDILSMVANPLIGHRLHGMFCEKGFNELTIEEICYQLAMSESTLRRKLKLEGTSVQEIKDQARLGLGLELLQKTRYSIGLIAEKCGYQSQSRFTDRFKGRFGLTPSELRKTQIPN